MHHVSKHSSTKTGDIRGYPPDDISQFESYVHYDKCLFNIKFKMRESVVRLLLKKGNICLSINSLQRKLKIKYLMQQIVSCL